MQDSAGPEANGELDELDLAVLNALQVSPRASWSQIGAVLGVDPVTAARRWSRLTATGRAWISCYLGTRHRLTASLAFVEMDCEPGRALTVARAAAADPRVATVEHTTGGRDLLLTVMTADLKVLSRVLLEDLDSLPGVRSTRSQVVTQVHLEGSTWRLPVLDAAQQAALRPPRPPSGTVSAELTAMDRRIALALGRDARISYTDLADEIGMSVTSLRRRLDRLLSDGLLVLRCEIARTLSGWPVSASLWANVPPDAVEETARLVGGMREARLVVSLTGGTSNMLFTLWLRSPSDVQRLEAELARRVPRLVVVDRALALHHVKRMGRLLDEEGRAIGAVPMDFW